MENFEIHELLKKRGIAFAIDLFSGVVYSILILLIYSLIIKVYAFLYLLYAYPVILLCKDVIGGKSIGKRIMKMKIVDENNEKPSTFKLVLRNILIITLLLEIPSIIKTGNRLGGRFTKTRVVNDVA